eukprot:2400701-Prymnesium_polylepis.1
MEEQLEVAAAEARRRRRRRRGASRSSRSSPRRWGRHSGASWRRTRCCGCSCAPGRWRWSG